MKKLSAVALAATLISASAFAGDHTINAVGRAGWIYKDNDKVASNSSSFNIDYLRTTFAGAVTPSVKYFLTADLLGNAGSADHDKVDNTSSYIDEVFVTKTFSFGTSLTVGKKAVLVGGREYDYADYDRYTSSYFKQATPGNQVGATVSHDIAGQTITAQYFNGNKLNGKTENSQSKFGWAVGWYGDIAHGMIKPIVAYTVAPEAAGDATTISGSARVNKGNDQFLGTGLQFNLPMGLTVEGDYNLLTEKDAAGTITAKKDLKTTSIVALVRYSTDRFAPFVKFISDSKKNDSVKTNKRTAYDIGVEFKEAKDDAIRYHVVYSGATVKDNLDTAETKSSPKSILVGLKFDAAILK